MIPNIFEVVDEKLLAHFNLTESDLKDASHLIVVGPNASGKSFLRKMFSAVCPDGFDCKVLHLSQQGRCTSGVIRAFVYGSEDDNSTGQNTSHMIHGAFSSSKKWDNDYIILFDEPEIGLSEEAQYGAGIFIKEHILKHGHDKFRGCVVMTHSKHIVRELSEIPGTKFLDLSRTYNTWEEWYNRPIVPGNLKEIEEHAYRSYREIEKILSEMKEERKDKPTKKQRKSIKKG